MTLEETQRSVRVESYWLLVAASILFVAFSQRPLTHTDLYAHLAYGRMICESGALPAADPFLPLANETPLTNTAWLSQLAGYSIFRTARYGGLQIVFAALVTLATVFTALAVLERTRNLVAAVIGGGLFLLINWQQIIIIRPQTVAVVCYSALLWLLIRMESRRRVLAWPLLFFVLFVVWANCHGSFVVGILTAVCFVIPGFLSGTDSSRSSRVPAGIVPLIIVAVVCNPYGIHLLLNVVRFAGNPNLNDIVEWGPLTLQMSQGRIAGAAAGTLLVLCGLRRRIRLTDALLLTGLGGGMLVRSRLLVWWAPVAAIGLAETGHAVLSQWFASRRSEANR